MPCRPFHPTEAFKNKSSGRRLTFLVSAGACLLGVASACTFEGTTTNIYVTTRDAGPGNIGEGEEIDPGSSPLQPVALDAGCAPGPFSRLGLGETCDGVDNDCDGEVDEDVVTRLYADQDGDGYGDPNLAIDGCFRSGFVADNTDCNDLDPTMHPNRAEACDNQDNDCNGLVDDGVLVKYFRDADGDGFGDGLNSPAQGARGLPPGFLVARQLSGRGTRPESEIT